MRACRPFEIDLRAEAASRRRLVDRRGQWMPGRGQAFRLAHAGASKGSEVNGTGIQEGFERRLAGSRSAATPICLIEALPGVEPLVGR